MISNKDPTGKKAINHIKLCYALNSAVPLAMSFQGILNPAFLAPFYFYQLRALKAVTEFEKQDGDP